MTAQFRTLHPKEQPECLRLWTQVFSPRADYFIRYFEDPHWQPHYCRVCEVEGELVSAVQVVRRSVRLNGHALQMAGIANVATLPQHRRHGYSTHLMQEANAVIDTEDFVFGLLFTGIHEFYERLGWHRFPLTIGRSTPQPMDLGSWHFRTAEVDDLPRIEQWYDAFYASRPLSVIRNRTYWTVWTRWEDPIWRNSFYVAEEAGEPRGYLAIETHHRTQPDGSRSVSALSVNELGAHPDDSEALRMLVAFASTIAYQSGAENLYFHLSPADLELLVRPVLGTVQPHRLQSPMVRVGNKERLWEAFALLGDPPPEAVFQLEVPVALALLFGLEPPEDIPLPPEIRKRYPLRPACYSPVDSF